MNFQVEYVLNAHDEIIQVGQGWDTFETVHRHKDGHLIDIEITTNYIKESNQFAVFARDISARKRAELELRIASTAFESLEGIMITDAHGIILRVNQAFIETTGYLAEEVIGKTPRILKSGYHDEDFYSEMWKRIGEDGRWEGEIWDRRKNGEVYPKWLAIKAIKHSDGTVINYVSTQIDISARKSAEEAVKHLAFFDPLTELPNRRLLLDRVHQAFACSNRTGKCGALLFIDLDNFKSLNDTLGHAVGDLLLQEVAKRLTASVREGDTVARLGGDEFVVVLEGLSEQALEAATQAEWVGLKILASLKRPYLLGNYEHRCSGSVGATLFQDHLQSFDELLRQADISMYQAKKAGRNALRFFAPEMQNNINLNFALEKELHDAVDRNQFELHYQIQVDGSYRPVGVECLIRWMHPARGLVAPNLFIPLAEESGIILSLGAWVLETACAQLKAWQQYELTRHLVLAVNVSAKQFHQKQFAQQVIELVTSYAINPKLLKLELTESMLVDDVESTIVTMRALREIGIQFSLDDFGTGYSSLQYLKRLPLDQLKIDMSFVRNIVTDHSDRTIVHTIVSMAQSLNLDVIAEGVETEEQRLILLNTGCAHLQGYLFSKPLPLGKFELLLNELQDKQARCIEVSDPHLASDEFLVRQRDHHLLAVLDSMPALIGYWDKNLRNRFGNQAYASWFGITPAQLLGKHLREVLGEKLSALNWQYVEAALRGERQVFERIMPTPDGTSHRHSLAEYIPHIGGGEVLGFYVHITDVSALKESEHQHQRAEAKFRALFESNQDAILLADSSGFYDCNQTALTIFGCATKAEIVASHPDTAFWSEPSAVFDFDRIVKSGRFDFESFCNRINSGEAFPVRVRLSVIQVEGQPVLQFVIRDITERKKNEKALEINKRILDTTTDGFWLTDAKGHIQVANKAYSDLIGYSIDEVQHMHIGQLEAIATSKDDLIAHAKRIIELGSDQFETQHRHKDGRRIDIEVTTSYLQETQQFAVFSRDITQRKQTEAALRESEALLRGLFDLSPLGIALLDTSGHLIQFNEAFRTICGYPEQELKFLDYWKLTLHPFVQGEEAQMEQLLRSGRFGPYEMDYIRKDGSQLPIRLNALSMTMKQGENYIWAIVEDISREKSREQDLLMAIQAANAANRAKSSFLATMSHELRTPMNGVMGMAQLLQMPKISEAERQEFLLTLLSSGQQMMDMISTILEYADIESKPDILCQEISSPSFMIGECVALMSHLAEDKGLSVEVATASIENELFMLDSARLRQMLRILFDNAIKFTQVGQIQIEAKVIGCEGATAELEFSVVDSGIGIPFESQAKVFDAFTQADGTSTRKFGGTGLGLATVKRLALLMGGSVGVESEEGAGSRIWFTIMAGLVSS